MSAEESLLQLQGWLESDIPPATSVRDSLYLFADWVKFGGPPVRQQMLEQGAYEAVTKAWSLICYSGIDGTVTLFSPDANGVREASLAALYSLTAGFPEIIDQVGWIMIQQSVDTRMPDTTLTFAMKLIRNICIKSESNREYISWELELMEPLVLLIRRDKPSPEFVREMLIKNTMSLLRYLNVSQTVRLKCNAFGLVKWVLQIMMQYKASEGILEVGCSCLAFMTLRNACHTAQLIMADGVSVLLEIMDSNMETIQIMKGGCLTLRNVAANGGNTARSSILDKGGEELVRTIWEKFPDLRENYVKPVLRDLGVLKEDEIFSQNVKTQQQQQPTLPLETEVDAAGQHTEKEN